MNRQKGFTLLEVMITFVIFAILLQGLLNFFVTIYKNTKDFEIKAYLVNQARLVEDFITEQIREAELVKIECSGGDIEYITSASNNIEVSGTLRSIKLSEDTVGKQILVEAVPTTEKGKGRYRLQYDGGGITKNLVSDQIETISVIRKRNSDFVTFNCVFGKSGETDESMKLKIAFSVQLVRKDFASATSISKRL